ncbi:MAG: hypothetical protein AAGE43_04315 [Pseudomonadota bacterium]
MEALLEVRRPGVLETAFSRHRAFTGWALFYGGLGAMTLMFGLLDLRTLDGVPVWSKPTKFNLSLVFYFLTLAWLAPLLGAEYFRSPFGRLLTALPIFAAALEMSYIIFQAARGEPSHFNVSTTFHAVAYSIMGFGAAVMVGVCAFMGARILWIHRARLTPYVFGAGFGLLLTCLLGGGFGSYLGSQAGHAVAVEMSDATRLPLTGWVQNGGDLRVAHFFGMHAMQLVPLAGWLLGICVSSRQRGLLLTAVVALVYSAVALVTFLQALTAEPFPGFL